MDTLDLVLVLGIAASVVALILAERKESERGQWIFKPLASALFVILGFPVFDGWLFAALVLSFLGDLCLVPKDKRIFRAGILLFLLAHVGFSGAFLARGIDWTWTGLALVPLVVAAALVARWILPKAPKELKGAVIAYMIVITAMVALAVGTHDPAMMVAALAFWTNDILVARDRFVTRSWLNRAYGLPLYYGAMVVFALTASASL